MPTHNTLSVTPRDGHSNPHSNLESQLMPPPKVIPCDPGLAMRQLGEVSSSAGPRNKEEIGKKDLTHFFGSYLINLDSAPVFVRRICVVIQGWSEMVQ